MIINHLVTSYVKAPLSALVHVLTSRISGSADPPPQNRLQARGDKKTKALIELTRIFRAGAYLDRLRGTMCDPSDPTLISQLKKNIEINIRDLLIRLRGGGINK